MSNNLVSNRMHRCRCIMSKICNVQFIHLMKLVYFGNFYVAYISPIPYF